MNRLDAPAFERILTALHDHGMTWTRQTDAARSQCPAHDSKGLTLALRRDADRARVHCFAGCQDIDVLAALGMGVRDLFDGPPAPGYTPPARPVLSPWEAALAELGIRNGPSVEHLLHRIEVEAIKEGRR